MNEHKYFQIITADKKMRFEIFSYFDTDPGSWVYNVLFSDDDAFEDYLKDLTRHSYEDIAFSSELDVTDKVVTLSTCSANEMRFTIHGVLVESVEN